MQRVEDGDFVILDNSAHETGFGVNAEKLREIWAEISANEVVLPDRLFFGEDTSEGSMQAAKLFREIDPKVRPRLMGCPQGRTYMEWHACLTRLVHNVGVDTIGISKDYETWDGGLARLAWDAYRTWDGMRAEPLQVHMLGWGRDLQALRWLSQYKFVRGVDSAKPIVYAANNIQLNPSSRVQYPGRKDYFNLALTTSQAATAVVNINVMKQMAGSPSASDA